MKNLKPTKVVFNIPANINLDDLFTKPAIQLKACFLLQQINAYSNKGGYTLNVDNHDWLFGSKGITSKIIKVLKTNNLIIASSVYVPGAKSYQFKMVNPFTVTKANDKKKIYTSVFVDREGEGAPIFVQKWVTDGFLVKNANTTSFVRHIERKPKPEPASTPIDVQSQLDEMTKTIFELTEENKRLKEALRLKEVSTVEDIVIDENSHILESYNKPIALVAEALEEVFNFQHEKNSEYIFNDFKVFKSNEDIRVIIYNDEINIRQINSFVRNYLKQSA